MGNMHGTVYRNGKQIDVGYGVRTTCEQPGCTERIDRGMAYLCGSQHGGDEYSCGGYFCGQHLYGAPEGHLGNRCSLDRDRVGPTPPRTPRTPWWPRSTDPEHTEGHHPEPGGGQAC